MLGGFFTERNSTRAVGGFLLNAPRLALWEGPAPAGPSPARVEAFGKNPPTARVERRSVKNDFIFNLIGMCLWGGEGVGKREGVKPMVEQ